MPVRQTSLRYPYLSWKHATYAYCKSPGNVDGKAKPFEVLMNTVKFPTLSCPRPRLCSIWWSIISCCWRRLRSVALLWSSLVLWTSCQADLYLWYKNINTWKRFVISAKGQTVTETSPCHREVPLMRFHHLRACIYLLFIPTTPAWGQQTGSVFNHGRLAAS